MKYVTPSPAHAIVHIDKRRDVIVLAAVRGDVDVVKLGMQLDAIDIAYLSRCSIPLASRR